MKKLLLASAALALLVTPSFSADAIVEELPPGFSWTGVYIGGQAGYIWGDSDVRGFIPGTVAAGTSFRSSPSPDGFLGGVYVGYNYQLENNLVLGAEADVFWSNADDTAPVFNAAGAAIAGASINQEIKWGGALRGRIGYAIDRFLPYVAGGVAFADVDHTATYGAVTAKFDDTYIGWTIGAGAEYAFTDNLILRAEYRYSDYGSESFDLSSLAAGATAKSDLQTHDVRIGLSYKF